MNAQSLSMDGFVWVPVSSLVLSLKSCIVDPNFCCFNFLRQIYLNPCQINGFCHRNLCDFVPCGDLASQVCGGWFGKLNPRPCLTMLGENQKNWKEQRPNNQKSLNKNCSSNLHAKPKTMHTPREHIQSHIHAHMGSLSAGIIRSCLLCPWTAALGQWLRCDRAVGLRQISLSSQSSLVVKTPWSYGGRKSIGGTSPSMPPQFIRKHCAIRDDPPRGIEAQFSFCL